MTTYYQDDQTTVYHGDCIEVMRNMPENSVDAIVTDPPYGLGFMGAKWDALPPGKDWADECLRVLKPGGHLLAFGGTRTWHRLAVAIEDAGFEIRDSVMWLYGSGFPKSHDVGKAIDKQAGKAAEWSGWGTALKPATEPIVAARKPLVLPPVNVVERVELGLREQGVRGEIKWTKRPASDAAKPGQQTNSWSTDQRPMAGTSASHADASATLKPEKRTARRSEPHTGNGAGPTLIGSESTPAPGLPGCDKQSSTHTDESASAAESKKNHSSPSTISAEEGRSTEGNLDLTSTQTCKERDSHPGTESFASIATGLTGSQSIARISRLSNGNFVWPDGLPKQVAARKLTVASNVLEHGTGAINIDATRIDSHVQGSRTNGSANDVYGDLSGTAGQQWTPSASGRWPANVILDEYTAQILDQQTDHLKGGVTVGRNRNGNIPSGGYDGGWKKQTEDITYGDSGGASRFFYVAKAPKRERPEVNGVKHTTVKPLTLMRYLVRMVTPPNGIVLDPFAGSGTTIEAAILDRFRSIGIESADEYMPLIQQRIDRSVGAIYGETERKPDH